MTDRILSDTSLATLHIDEERGIVTLVRKDTPMDLEALATARAEIVGYLPMQRRAHLAIVFDMRKAPLARPEVEAALLTFASDIQRGFLAWATVIATAVGKLQASRIRREGHIQPGHVASTVEEARAQLERLVREHRAASRPTARG